jgi:SAM-dependent methyltransferase
MLSTPDNPPATCYVPAAVPVAAPGRLPEPATAPDTPGDEPHDADTQLSWAAYALDGRLNVAYFATERYYASFPAGAIVLDVGCGAGDQLQALLDRGCTGLGLEVTEACLAAARATGRPVIRARAEAIPRATASVDGIVFRAVLPYVGDEAQTFAELARVLRPGGRLEAEYIGLGYALRDLVLGRTLRARYYGLRSLANSLLVELLGRRLPGWHGDTAYVTPRRLARHYARSGLRLVAHTPSPTFLGLPVFLYHAVERAGPRERSVTRGPVVRAD